MFMSFIWLLLIFRYTKRANKNSYLMFRPKRWIALPSKQEKKNCTRKILRRKSIFIEKALYATLIVANSR